MNRFKASRIFKEQKGKFIDESFRDSKGFLDWYNDTEQYMKDLCKSSHWLRFNSARTMDEYHRAIDSCIEYVENTRPLLTDIELNYLKLIGTLFTGTLIPLIALLLSKNLREDLCAWLQSF